MAAVQKDRGEAMRSFYEFFAGGGYGTCWAWSEVALPVRQRLRSQEGTELSQELGRCGTEDRRRGVAHNKEPARHRRYGVGIISLPGSFSGWWWSRSEGRPFWHVLAVLDPDEAHDKRRPGTATHRAGERLRHPHVTRWEGFCDDLRRIPASRICCRCHCRERIAVRAPRPGHDYS